MNTETRTTLISVAASSVCSTVLAGFVAFGFQVWGDSITLQKTAKLETVLEYAKTESPIAPFAAKYIAAISGNGDLASAQTDLRGKLADEMERAEKLKPLFKSVEPAIDSYLTALTTFSDTIDTATDATKMRVWSERFGHVIDSRLSLERHLMTAAGA